MEPREPIIRIQEIEINGIKNVCHGVVSFNEYNDIKKRNFINHKSVLGIYGQNGSGKTTILEVTELLRTILSGDKIQDDFNQFICNECDKVDISFTFFFNVVKKELITYSFSIELIDNVYQISHEKIVSKEYDDELNKWKPQVTLIECSHQEITLKKLSHRLPKEILIELKVAQDIEKGTSFIFNKRNVKILIEQIQNMRVYEDTFKLTTVLFLLPYYVKAKLIIIENDVMGSVNLNTYIPINLYLSSNSFIQMAEIPVNLLKPNEMSKDTFKSLYVVVKQIDTVINAIIPSLHIQIINEKEVLLKDGEIGISFEIVSVRNEKYIPLKYESEGIKRLISVISALIAMYNDESICLMIDEFDSGIFEYLLGELIEIIDESAKGQFLFTSHNLRALEKLSYKSIIITTTNPQNRFIQMTGIKPNNNVRDYYYANIILGGQKESIYDETKNYKIKRAFRKAGIIND